MLCHRRVTVLPSAFASVRHVSDEDVDLQDDANHRDGVTGDCRSVAFAIDEDAPKKRNALPANSTTPMATSFVGLKNACSRPFRPGQTESLSPRPPRQGERTTLCHEPIRSDFATSQHTAHQAYVTSVRLSTVTGITTAESSALAGSVSGSADWAAPIKSRRLDRPSLAVRRVRQVRLPRAAWAVPCP